jgi:hypothetical protein
MRTQSGRGRYGTAARSMVEACGGGDRTHVGPVGVQSQAVAAVVGFQRQRRRQLAVCEGQDAGSLYVGAGQRHCHRRC